jgi:uncharacterized protein Usg
MRFLLRFSIRDLLWFVPVVAMASGWWLHAQKLSQRCSEQLSSEREKFRRYEYNLEGEFDSLKAEIGTWRENYKGAVEWANFLGNRLAKAEGWIYDDGPPSSDYKISN